MKKPHLADAGTNANKVPKDRTAACTTHTGPASYAMVVAQTWSVNGYAVKSDTITYTCPGPPTGAP